MPKKQSSSRLSTIAANVLRTFSLKLPPGYKRNMFVVEDDLLKVRDIKALAASVLSQDETKGQRKRLTTFTVKPGTDFGWKIYEGKVQIGFSPRKTEAVTLAKQQAARLRPSRVKVGAKIVKEFK